MNFQKSRVLILLLSSWTYMVHEINENELESLTKSKKIVIVDFSAVWCGPCKSIARILEAEVEPKLVDKPDVALVKIDIDKNKNLAQGLQILSVPTIMIFFHGKRVVLQGEKGQDDRIVGFHPKMGQILMDLVGHLEKMPPPNT